MSHVLNWGHNLISNAPLVSLNGFYPILTANQINAKTNKNTTLLTIATHAKDTILIGKTSIPTFSTVVSAISNINTNSATAFQPVLTDVATGSIVELIGGKVHATTVETTLNLLQDF